MSFKEYLYEQAFSKDVMISNSGEFYLIVFHLVIGVIGIVWIGIDLLILSYKEKQKER